MNRLKACGNLQMGHERRELFGSRAEDLESMGIKSQLNVIYLRWVLM